MDSHELQIRALEAAFSLFFALNSGTLGQSSIESQADVWAKSTGIAESDRPAFREALAQVVDEMKADLLRKAQALRAARRASSVNQPGQ
jgi:hypothetical protein